MIFSLRKLPSLCWTKFWSNIWIKISLNRTEMYAVISWLIKNIFIELLLYSRNLTWFLSYFWLSVVMQRTLLLFLLHMKWLSVYECVFINLLSERKKKKPDKRCACRTYKELVQSKKKTFSSTEKKGGGKRKNRQAHFITENMLMANKLWKDENQY